MRLGKRCSRGVTFAVPASLRSENSITTASASTDFRRESSTSQSYGRLGGSPPRSGTTLPSFSLHDLKAYAPRRRGGTATKRDRTEWQSRRATRHREAAERRSLRQLE